MGERGAGKGRYISVYWDVPLEMLRFKIFPKLEVLIENLALNARFMKNP